MAEGYGGQPSGDHVVVTKYSRACPRNQTFLALTLRVSGSDVQRRNQAEPSQALAERWPYVMREPMGGSPTPARAKAGAEARGAVRYPSPLKRTCSFANRIKSQLCNSAGRRNLGSSTSAHVIISRSSPRRSTSRLPRERARLQSQKPCAAGDGSATPVSEGGLMLDQSLASNYFRPLSSAVWSWPPPSQVLPGAGPTSLARRHDEHGLGHQRSRSRRRLQRYRQFHTCRDVESSGVSSTWVRSQPPSSPSPSISTTTA